MLPITLKIVLAVAVVFASLYIFSQRRRRKFPPGPWGLPIVGHLPLLGQTPHQTVVDWRSKYGPIVGLNFGSYPCFIISDYKLSKEALALAEFAGHKKLGFLRDRCGRGNQLYGIAFSEGRFWDEQRTFAYRTLREIGGFGTRKMEISINEQVIELVDKLRVDAEAGVPISTANKFNVAILNPLWAIITSEPFDHSDPCVAQLNRLFEEAVSELNLFVMLPMFMPWVYKWVPGWITRRQDLEKLYQPFIDFAQPYIDQRFANHVAGQPINFIDAYIDEMQAADARGDVLSSFHPTIGRQTLEIAVLDLFQGGAVSMAATLAWLCLLLAMYPAVQERLYGEIHFVIGNKTPSLEDRKSMPFLEAVLHEVFRFRPLIPLLIFRSTTEAVDFHGFELPKDTMYFVNVWEAHFNHELWGDDVNKFRPERWLDQDDKFVKREGLLYFSSGRRVCLGEQMARDELFLFTVGLFQSFTFSVDQTKACPTLEPKIGSSLWTPQPHQLLLTVRK